MAFWLWKAVVRIGPRGRLCRILAGGANQGGETGQPEAAALADHGELPLVPGERQGDLIWLPKPVAARHRGNREN